MPRVSIGLPVYNGEGFIRKALESTLSQKFADFELVISDNASTDGTEAICREYAENDSRIRYIRQPENIGAQKNFTYVVHESVGEYFTWLAHDDALKEDFLSECVGFLDENPNTHLVSGDFSAIDDAGSDLGVRELREIRFMIPWSTRATEFFRFPVSNAFFCIYGLMRRKILVDVLSHIRTGPMLSASELPLLSRFAAVGEIASLARVLRVYRYHAGSVFHQEIAQLSSLPVKGRLLNYYNAAWHRTDQLIVLVRSGSPIEFKLHVLYNLLKYYAGYFSTRLWRFVSRAGRQNNN